MKFLFKQRFFSWFDSYDIYDEAGRVACKVKGELAWGHMFRIYDANGRELGAVKQEIFSFMPRFNIYIGNECVGSICREFALFAPKYNIDFKNWRVEGDWFEWDYSIFDGSGREVASITKELWNWTDTYSVDVRNPEDALCALMLVLAIDAEKCSRDD
mgnify:FL=1